MELKEYAQAEEYLNESIEGYKSYGDTQNGFSTVCQIQGDSFFRLKQYEDALFWFEQALEYDEFGEVEVVQIYLDMAVAYEELGNIETAENYYKRQYYTQKRLRAMDLYQMQTMCLVCFMQIMGKQRLHINILKSD